MLLIATKKAAVQSKADFFLGHGNIFELVFLSRSRS
jgi:hypothetical protein